MDYTRREYVKNASKLIGIGTFTGCLGENTSESRYSTVDSSYSVTMSPMGEVSFENVPERVYTGLPNNADMAVAAGKSDSINSIYYPEYHGSLLNNFYDRLEGVSLNWESLTDSWNLGKEGFYELDSDVHLTDPVYASTLEKLDTEDVKEIKEKIGPWFGNYYSDRNREPPKEWSKNYKYYTLWEIFKKTSQVFHKKSRAQKLTDIHSSMISTIKSNLPPLEKRPKVALTFKGKEDSFWVYRLNADGFLTAHTRPLGAVDAFSKTNFEGAQMKVDYEAMLDANPDVILVLFTMSPSYSISKIKDKLNTNAVTKEISAVKNDRVYAQGARYQGPILNLFQLEMTAKQLYPEKFGKWPTYVDGPYPEIPENEQLFDREKVSNIIKGNI